MLLIVLTDIFLILAIGVPAFLVHRKWRMWVDRLSDRRWPFEHERRFGSRSWAARSFVVDTHPDEVFRQVDALTEAEWGEPNPLDLQNGNEFAAFAPLLGSRAVSTGVSIEWMDGQTAVVRSRLYSDWPETAEKSADLPLKQRQRLAEQAMLYVEPQSGTATRVSYELRLPGWVYLIPAAALMLMAWVTWGFWRLQGVEKFTVIAAAYGTRPEWLLWNTPILWLLTGWAVVHIVKTIRLQNISLLDNIIAAFGPLLPARPK